MKVAINPKKDLWKSITVRPKINKKELADVVKKIMADVEIHGDTALLKYTQQHDKVSLNSLKVSNSEIDFAIQQTPKKLKDAIKLAYDNIFAFHKTQLVEENTIETTSGVKCWRKSVAIETVGLYIPGGTAPLFSTILMLGIPAKIAGCKNLILCTPPQKNKQVNAAILYAANLVGITQIFKVGGAQAIAAMTYGTESIPPVNKLFGPGNQYVTKAKELAQQNGIAIDMPAGPSELLVIADASCNPSFVAADLLSQAEHGADSQVILLSNNKTVIQNCISELNRQVELLPRKNTAIKALNNSKAIVLNNLQECFDFSNYYAPEHLIIAIEQASNYVDKIVNAGSVFLGNFSCESAGDYASGTNHTLPTNGYAKSYSGVSVDSFVKKITFQEISKDGILSIGNAIEVMAEAEGLIAHKNAVSYRLKSINNE